VQLRLHRCEHRASTHGRRSSRTRAWRRRRPNPASCSEKRPWAGPPGSVWAAARRYIGVAACRATGCRRSASRGRRRPPADRAAPPRVSPRRPDARLDNLLDHRASLRPLDAALSLSSVARTGQPQMTVLTAQVSLLRLTKLSLRFTKYQL